MKQSQNSVNFGVARKRALPLFGWEAGGRRDQNRWTTLGSRLYSRAMEGFVGDLLRAYADKEIGGLGLSSPPLKLFAFRER
jgi:hypothetical protein